MGRRGAAEEAQASFSPLFIAAGSVTEPVAPSTGGRGTFQSAFHHYKDIIASFTRIVYCFFANSPTFSAEK